MGKRARLNELFRKREMSRRGFLRFCMAGLALLAAHAYVPKFARAKETVSDGRMKKRLKGDYDLVSAKGKDPYRMTIETVKSMGGMERFVKKNDVVVIKPNMAWDRTPKQAANTNPAVVSALVNLCHEAGAKRVNIFDITCNEARRCYENSGIAKAAREAGAHVYFADEWNIAAAHFGYASELEGWPILRDALECDAFINVPVLKHHSLAGLTLSMKNLMGVCCGNRSKMHTNIGRNLVDLTDFISPELTVIDGYRVLTDHGPSGGDLKDVVELNTIFVATDPTLADAYACRLLEKDPLSVPNIRDAVSRNFGTADVDKADILHLNV